MIDIPCVIFAGGKSSRMGEDKALLPFSTFNTLTQFQLHRLQKLFKNVYISCKNSDKFDFEADFIEDVKTENTFAPTAGFVAIFEKLKDERIFVISVDTPFVDEEEINKIIQQDNPHAEITIAQTACGNQPMFGIYHSSLQNKFIAMLQANNHKLGLLIKESQTTYVKFENEEPFLNLNHPHEYKQALKLI